jgi:hypothetical protein
MPNTYARGILFGKLILELCDVSAIHNPQTEYHCDVDFKAKVRRHDRISQCSHPRVHPPWEPHHCFTTCRLTVSRRDGSQVAIIISRGWSRDPARAILARCRDAGTL